MPPETKCQRYSAEAMKAAIFAVREGGLARKVAAAIYGVPRTTLVDKLSGKSREGKGRGRDPFLTDDEEEAIVTWIKECCRRGLPPHKNDILNTVQRLIKDIPGRKSPFRNDRPGRGWFEGFMRRHQDLSVRIPEGVSKARSQIIESTSSSSTSDAAPSATQPSQCSCCSELLLAKNFYEENVKVAIKRCKHANDNCCCKNMFKNSFVTIQEDKTDSTPTSSKKTDCSNFFSRYDSELDEDVHFCRVCCKYPNPGRGRVRPGESWTVGITFKDTSSENKAKKVHLQSRQHKEAIAFRNCGDAHQIEFGRPTAKERQNATKNTMIAGIFMASHCLPYSLYTALCTLLAIICPSHLSHPLGNRYQTYSGFKDVMLANYAACATTMRNYFSTTFSATKSKRKFSIFCDQGTAAKDVSRQAIVATYVAENGLPKEALLDLSKIRQGDVLTTANHIKQTIASFMDPSSVAFICSSEHAACTEIRTVEEELKVSEEYNYLVGLPDFCHKMEKLLNETLPQWVLDTLATCRAVAAFINDHNVKDEIHKHINVVRGSIFTAIPNQPQNCSAEYVHLHLEATLKNIQIFLESLPGFLDEHNSLSIRTKNILKLLANESFVVRCMMICRLYRTISNKEKAAQDPWFGPLEYKHQVDSLASELCELKAPSIEIQSFIKSGTLNFNSDTFSSTEHRGMNLESVASKLGIKTRNTLDESRDNILTTLIEENSAWIDEICLEAPNYLLIPVPIVLATESFSLHQEFDMIEENLTALINLFDLLNVQFESCGSECMGVRECTCLKKDYVKFMDDFQSEWEAAPDNKLIRIGSATAQSYTHAFAHYISTNNSTPTYPVNIIRCLEVIQLMKPTLAATERVMSHAEIAVRNRFESKYYTSETKLDEDAVFDDIQNEVFLRCNTNIVQHDAELAKTIFLTKHKESLIQNKKSTTKSRAIKNYMSKLGINVAKKFSQKRQNVPDQKQADCKRRKIDCCPSDVLENTENSAPINSVPALSESDKSSEVKAEIVLEQCPEDADGCVWCDEQSLPQVSAGEVKSEALEFGALSSDCSVAIEKMDCLIDEVYVKVEPRTAESSSGKSSTAGGAAVAPGCNSDVLESYSPTDDLTAAGGVTTFWASNPGL
ncbi:uncharacterized protein LOC108672321 isoform X2 [Hyalella azteca]|uniref:Uncharacterized protein LOC108672321 isoform X2 n=1 Tax=Hyalella azteca TaxID=294128 RepID=A0A979FVQ1_HYAAZ|nr:uncharacterized protein LOC108672321 isoform X2 [Hyalella azteca]